MFKVFLLTVILGSFSQAGDLKSELIKAQECVIHFVALKMNVVLIDGYELPTIHLESEIKIEEYQTWAEPVWHIKPEVVVNSFFGYPNKLVLFDDMNYYIRHKRFIFDSLVHELVHFVQEKYQGITAEEMHDAEEIQAIGIQTEFREEYRDYLQQESMVCPVFY